LKIGVLGSAPSSLGLAPFGDPSWKFFGCSPGVYPHVSIGSLRGWFELHRWEPGEIGKPGTQKPWFSPEYVQWMRTLPPHVNLWMSGNYPDTPNGKRLPIEDIAAKYGTYFLTSSVSIMMACAIEDILEERQNRQALFDANPPTDAEGQAARDAYQPEPDIIGLWGVDMAASEEYGYQRAGCQYFCTLANTLGIKIQVPAESDLLRPMPIYGFAETEWWHIKLTARQRELQGRLAGAQARLAATQGEVHFLQGALDDMEYHLQTWGGDRDGAGVDISILAQSPDIQRALKPAAPQPILLGELGPNGEIPGAKRLPLAAGTPPKNVIKKKARKR
jgi:hypothetical protein